MSSEAIRQNTSDLREILDMIEDLPEAGGASKEEYEKTVNITENGTTEISPDEGKTFSKVTINTNVLGGGAIGNELFNKLANKTITEVTTGDLQGVTSLPRYMFYNCKELVSAELPETITTLETQAFSTCSKLVLTHIPASIKTFQSQVFFNCAALTSITFKGTPTSIYNNIFDRCTNLTTINVPWAEGTVANAPWGATNATINYNYVQ